MIKKLNIFMTAAAALMLAACSSEDLPLTHPDGYGEINFTVGNDAGTRADGDDVVSEIVYIPYDYNRDPHSMGVYGWHDLSSSTFDNDANKMFFNTKVEAALDEGIVTWSYDDKKYWVDYVNCGNFDFFGYMPYNKDATLTSANPNEYTLSMPVVFKEGFSVFSPEETALVCNAPKHLLSADGTIPFQMDQTLMAYTLVFQLGDKMDNVRDFIIKDVKIYGEGMAHAGTLSRTYTWDFKDGWISSPVKWSDMIVQPVAQDEGKSIPYKNNAGDDADLKKLYTNGETEGTGTLRVTSTPVQWGTPIYMIPIPTAKPVFEVIYDVVVVDENGKDIVTRPDVHSIIAINEENFGSISQTAMGKTRPVTIKIVPDHLYVLADADQKFSWIVLGDGND